ncbi:glycosyltransferase family 4 protein [Halobellus limi]|uniref:Glycosyltransferase WbuB n=1 Tax=Halobellus limi TaxID=699433 RepID=A0A1H6BDK6_9EURY|nr:glycosyltransferase family 4 protein [Halobellus limi]QCC49295.1 glycosyltransferase WbuB [Halobellus limi]SEG58730.1 Glycosyltransferase involved in cell wall bisynthesis [Halobellus limi]
MSEDNPHVVVVSQHYPPDRSGNASRIRDTCTHLSEEAWDVTVLAPPPAFPHGQFPRTWTRRTSNERDGVRVHRLWAWQPTTTDPSFWSRMAYYLFFPLHALLWLLVHYREYDAVVTSSPPIFTGLAGLPFGLLTPKPWVVDVRDLWIDAAVGLDFITDGGFVERASRLYERVVLRTADRITVTTTVLGERLVERYGVDEATVRHVPNGVDTDRYRPTETDPAPTIVYTGNVGHAQDLDACVRAMASVETPGATLKIVGDGDITDRLKRVTAEEGLDDRVEFTGLVPRETIPGVLDDAMIGVAPLKREETLEYAVPTKAYEYMSCELPVVATGAGEIETLIEESGGGIHVENDADRLAEAFDSLLTDVALRESLGENGREHMVEHYDRAIVARRLSAILDEVIDR